jgi:tetratricopeptide (TPR) repeat protein
MDSETFIKSNCNASLLQTQIEPSKRLIAALPAATAPGHSEEVLPSQWKLGLAKRLLSAALVVSCIQAMSLPQRAWAGADAAATRAPALTDVTTVLDQEKPDASRLEAMRAAAAAPPPVDADSKALADYYFRKAYADSAIGRAREAIMDVSKAIELGQSQGVDLVPLYRYLGGELVWVGRPKEALQAFEKAIRIAEGDLHTRTSWVFHLRRWMVGTNITLGNLDAANREKCFDTILALWRHRHELPSGKRPFETLEPALRAMESLDPKNLENRYFPFARPPLSDGKESKETREWLELAEGLDYSARILIRHCISNAAAAAIDKSRPWVALAEEIGGQQVELPLLKIIMIEDDLSETDDPTDSQRKILEDRLGKLRTFLELATMVATDYERQLQGKKPKRRVAGKSGKVPTSSRLKRPEQVVVITGKTGRKKAIKKG